MNKDYNYYKKCAEKAADCLSEYQCVILKDLKVVYNLLMGFPYCLDGEQYIYNGNLYNSMANLPKQALEELFYNAKCSAACCGKLSDGNDGIEKIDSNLAILKLAEYIAKTLGNEPSLKLGKILVDILEK